MYKHGGERGRCAHSCAYVQLCTVVHNNWAGGAVLCAVAHSCAHHGGGGAGSGTVVHAILVSRAGMGSPTQGQRGGKKYQGAKPAISHTASLSHLHRSLCLVARLSATLSKKNIYQDMTPLLQACSTGCSDIVKLLCEKRANIYAQSKGRGALQLASATAGANNKLVKYLQEKYPDLPMTDIKSTRLERNRRGYFSSMVRDMTGPARDRGGKPH